MTTTSEPPPAIDRARPGKALPLQLGLPRPAAALPPAPPERERIPRSPREVVAWAAGIVLGCAVAAGAITLWALPWYVRRQCIEQAAAHGVALIIEDATLRASGFRLLGAAATFADVPGAIAKAAEIEVETTGLTPKTMTVRGAELTLGGHWSSLDAAFARWRASARGGQAGGWAPASLVALDSHIVWQGSLGEGGRVDAADVHLEVAWRAGGAELQAASDDVTVDVPGGKLGPWAVHLDRTPRGSRVRVALDPGVPEGCTILLIADGEHTTALDVVVHRSPMGRLGLPPAVLGLRGGDLQLEAAIHYATLGPRRADATAKGALYGLDAGFGTPPLTLAWEAAASGDPILGLDMKRSRLAVGPLVGRVTGVLRTLDEGARIDLAWSAGPVPCAAFDAPLGPGQPFEVAYALRQLTEGASRGRIQASASASAELQFDSRDPLAAVVRLTPTGTCLTP